MQTPPDPSPRKTKPPPAETISATASPTPTATSPCFPTKTKNEYLQALADFQKEWKPATATEHDLVGRLAARMHA
jgi:hypothetical protein